MAAIDESAFSAAAKSRLTAVKGSTSDPEKALKLALADPPAGSSNQETLDTSAQATLAAMAAFSDAKVEAGISQLEVQEQTILMSYIYKILAMGSDTASAVALKWHEKLTKVAGEACILRALSANPSILEASRDA